MPVVLQCQVFFLSVVRLSLIRTYTSIHIRTLAYMHAFIHANRCFYAIYAAEGKNRTDTYTWHSWCTHCFTDVISDCLFHALNVNKTFVLEFRMERTRWTFLDSVNWMTVTLWEKIVLPVTSRGRLFLFFSFGFGFNHKQDRQNNKNTHLKLQKNCFFWSCFSLRNWNHGA